MSCVKTFSVTDTQTTRYDDGGRWSFRTYPPIGAPCTMAVLREADGTSSASPRWPARAACTKRRSTGGGGTRERLVTDALLSSGSQDLPIPDTGSLRGDLAGFADGTQPRTCQTPLGRGAGAREVATPTVDPAIIEASAGYFRMRIRDSQRDHQTRQRSRRNPRSAPTAALALEMLIAPLHFRTLVSHQPLNDGLPARLADLVITGLRAYVDATPQPG